MNYDNVGDSEVTEWRAISGRFANLMKVSAVVVVACFRFVRGSCFRASSTVSTSTLAAVRLWAPPEDLKSRGRNVVVVKIDAELEVMSSDGKL
jgi:hypothetical protein